ncbi:hypothetical protein AB3S75_002585 [Citrus x aurantiifolia]
MEKARKMKTNLCIPRLRSANNGNNKNKTPAMTLLERFREAVFRLIMLSALSKATAAATTTTHNNYHHQAHVSRSYYNPADPHHSEAVADCIEFIKKKALTDDEDYDHNNSASDTDDSISIDATDTTELVMQVPIM